MSGAKSCTRILKVRMSLRDYGVRIYTRSEYHDVGKVVHSRRGIALGLRKRPLSRSHPLAFHPSAGHALHPFPYLLPKFVCSATVLLAQRSFSPAVGLSMPQGWWDAPCSSLLSTSASGFSSRLATLPQSLSAKSSITYGNLLSHALLLRIVGVASSDLQRRCLLLLVLLST